VLLEEHQVRDLIQQVQDLRVEGTQAEAGAIKDLEAECDALRRELDDAGEYTKDDLDAAREAGRKAGYAKGCADGRAEEQVLRS
jgi:hypothetical protein